MNAKQAMERAVAKLPTEYLTRYVVDFEARRLCVAWCAVVSMTGGHSGYCQYVDRAKHGTGAGHKIREFADHFDAHPLLAIESYYERWSGALGGHVPAQESERAAHIYTACVLEIARRRGARALPPARVETVG